MPSYEVKVAVHTTVVVQEAGSQEEAEEMAEDECWRIAGSCEIVKTTEIPEGQLAQYLRHADTII